MEAPKNRFEDEILEEVGEVPISDTQKIWVLIVKCKQTGRIMTSYQKWWRTSKDEEWVAGKGYKLNLQRGLLYAELASKACERLKNYHP